MKITPNQAFLHGYVRYEPDTEYDVPEADAVYFVRCGWADSDEVEAAEPPSAVVDLDVHDAISNQEG